MAEAKIIWVDETDSTNSALAYLARRGEATDGTVLAARAQSAGRGQRGNSWESAPGMNLTCSILFTGRSFDVAQHFLVSEAVALAVAEIVDDELSGCKENVSVKWPNDIYVGDKKVCGILIENVLTGRIIERCIAGIGVNINQEVFLSDAPNPVSLRQIDGKVRYVNAVLERIANRVLENIALGSAIHERYMERLWRKDGYHSYHDHLTGERIEARIADVLPCGHLILALPSGEQLEYAFKEVSALI
ncbi:MAG: biotin--[acetyl-CoA-carboxylase] ligase [Paramuribaculum sp.]|nr:biotin--[acetyl-CoA-carboxylase] ligase [Paramuribaculum sp.]